MERKKLIAIASALSLAVALLLAVLFSNGISLIGLGGKGEVGPGVAVAQFQKFQNPDRNAYGIGIFVDENRNSIEKPVWEAFVNLPKMPPDFAEKMHSMQGNFNSIAFDLNEAYYKQPEFLPKFRETGLAYWKSPDLKRWGREGFGVYPAETAMAIEPKNEVYITVFVHSAYGIETFQGIKLQPFLLGEGNLNELFSVSIEPENILLGPSYPVMNPNWIQKIRVKIRASEALEEGNWFIGFSVAAPDAWQDSTWAGALGSKYVSGQGIASASETRLKIRLRFEQAG